MKRSSLLALLVLAGTLSGQASTVRPVPGPLQSQAPVTNVQLTDSARAFGKLVASLSEPGGFFDTDNLISNESSYLHVMGLLDRNGVRGGAYIGVGPDQNFSYIARIRPHIVFIVDIRRDNLLQQLMFKALFTRARNRAEYLALWLGRPVPADIATWNDRTLEALVSWIKSAKVTTASAAVARAAVVDEAQKSGVALSVSDIATITRFHSAFIREGLDLQFTSAGRAPQYYYPTLEQLLLEKDLEGRMANYLVREADYQFLRTLERSNLVIPVVGDLSGAHALPAVGKYLAEHNEPVMALYTSNVEDYLFRDGTFAQYARTVASLPRTPRSVMIRSYFARGSHPLAVPGYASTQLLQTMASFATDVVPANYQYYRELVTRHFIPYR